MRVDSARVTDTLTVDDDFVVTVDDGSGPLELRLSNSIPFDTGPFLVPGADVKVSGLLVPVSAGQWQLKPRLNADLEVEVPVISIVDARATTVGEIVFIDGVALTARTAFADSTLHGWDFVMTVDDGSGALEVVLDKDITFNLTPLVVGTIVDVTGVLVPTGAGTWQLKPRGSGDIFIK